MDFTKYSAEVKKFFELKTDYLNGLEGSIAFLPIGSQGEELNSGNTDLIRNQMQDLINLNGLDFKKLIITMFVAGQYDINRNEEFDYVKYFQTIKIEEIEKQVKDILDDAYNMEYLEKGAELLKLK